MMRYFYSSPLIVVFVACLLSAQSLASSPRYTLECSADSYALGDSVFFTWTNNTDSTLVAQCQPPFEIYDAITGEMLYAGELPTEFWLPPHESAYLNWAQQDFFGNQVPPGAYLAYISFTFNGNPPPPWDHVEDWFRILLPASVPDSGPAISASSWGRLKQSCR